MALVPAPARHTYYTNVLGKHIVGIVEYYHTQLCIYTWSIGRQLVPLETTPTSKVLSKLTLSARLSLRSRPGYEKTEEHFNLFE